MMTFIPITLLGNNLGERHRHLNSLVTEAHRQGIPFEAIRDVPEQSPVDRLFKIELASRHRDVDYIIRNLKDEDMLYVSKALKSLWLLDTQYSDIINPVYLEDVLFPEMLTTAVNKMRHWIHLHLRDEQRCQDFYVYYKKRNYGDVANRFLLKCSADFLLKEVTVEAVEKLGPKYLKIVCEKCPQIAKSYFDNIESNETALAYYIDNENKYYTKLKDNIKQNTNIFLDIMEKYFNHNMFSRFNARVTKYIMKYHRIRFTNKPELYTAWFFDMKTLAKCLTNDEIKELVLKLARAEYLRDWFSYKTLEPLIKRVRSEERILLKKQIFVDKSLGENVQEWPYAPPRALIKEPPVPYFFSDIEYDSFYARGNTTQCNNQRELCFYDQSCRLEMSLKCCFMKKQKTLLDKLFDQYRFVSFKRTLYELRKRMATESNQQSREHMMLVLVSKSGGRAEAVEALVRLLVERHSNEPCTVRAAIVRSLVRRAAAWRLPSAIWESLVQFAHGLGLDGGKAEAPCYEGLHAVVLRTLLAEPMRTPEPAVFAAYLNQFSSLVEYSLDSYECRLIRARLPALLLEAARDAVEPAAVAEQLERVFDTLDTFKVRADECPGVVSALIELARRDVTAATPLLSRLFERRVARRQLFRENFVLVRSDASYVNALRHDTTLLVERFDLFKELIVRGQIHHERFLRTLALYFGEIEGLAARHLAAIEQGLFSSERPVQLARPLALLAGSGLAARVSMIDAELEAPPERRRLAAALRAHAHAARPPLDLAAFGWRAVGVKAIANRVLMCSARTAPEHIQTLFSYWRWTRLALILALRCGEEVPAFTTAAALRPGAALAAALRYLCCRGDAADARVWRAVRPLLTVTDQSSRFNLAHPARERLRQALANSKNVPRKIKADYCTIVYKALKKISSDDSKGQENLHELLCSTDDVLSELHEEFITNIVEDFLYNEFVIEKISQYDYIMRRRVCFKIHLIVKFLLFSKNEEELEKRFKVLGQPFLHKIGDLKKTSPIKFYMFLDVFMHSLKCNKIFLCPEFAACSRLFENILKWMHDELPVEEYFSLYAHMHLTMLYYKSIRQCIKLNPKIFSDDNKRENEGVEIVGMIYGKYIASEVKQLTSKYFSSVKYLYEKDVLGYIKNKFGYGEKRRKFISYINRGLVEEINNIDAQLLAQYIYLNEVKHYCSSDSEYVLNNLKKTDNQELQFFLYGGLYNININEYYD